jgi:hypothetical protein
LNAWLSRREAMRRPVPAGAQETDGLVQAVEQLRTLDLQDPRRVSRARSR